MLRSAPDGTHHEVQLLELPDGAALVRWESAEAAAARALPWLRPGWRDAAVAEVDRVLAASGRRRTAEPVQVKHWSISALLRFETDAGVVWRKDLPPVFAREGHVVRWLRSTGADVVPVAVHVDEGWWLAEDFGGGTVDADRDPRAALETLWALQQVAASRSDELLAIGVPDRRAVTPRLEALRARDDLLLTEPVETRTAGAVALIERALPTVARCEALLADRGLGPTLVHGDMHMGNVAVDGERITIFDWTDAAVACPAVDLGPCVGAEEQEAVRTAAERAYLSHWCDVTDDVVAASRVVAAAYSVDSYVRIVDGLPAEEAPTWTPAIGGWLRRLDAMAQVASPA